MQKDLKRFFDKYVPIVEDFLKNYINSIQTFPYEIFDAMSYSLFAGGKRIRPILCIASFLLFEKEENIEKVLPVAASLEFIHTYSLIHDDLPAMDNDDFRRGKPTLHKKYNEYTAILAGDALLNLAFELLSDKSYMKLKDETIVKIINIISRSSGVLGMIGGQMTDVMTEKENKEVDLPLLEFITAKKTGELIKASVLSGAYASEKCSENEIESLKHYSHNLGYLFQIVDDILDIIGDEKKLGKPVHKDTSKKIFPRVIGLEDSKSLAKHLNEKAKESLKVFGEKGYILSMISDFCEERSY